MEKGERILQIFGSEGYPNRAGEAASFILDNAVLAMVRSGLVTRDEVSQAITEATRYTVGHHKVVDNGNEVLDSALVKMSIQGIGQGMKEALRSAEQPGRVSRAAINVRRIING